MTETEVLLGVTRAQRNAILDAVAQSHASDVLGMQQRIAELEAENAHLRERLNGKDADDDED